VAARRLDDANRRTAPDASAMIVPTPVEIALLDRLVPNPQQAGSTERRLSSYLTKLAQRGGDRARTEDPPPGNAVIRRSISRLADIHLGFILARASDKWG
jgi:hypothetical protein